MTLIPIISIIISLLAGVAIGIAAMALVRINHADAASFAAMDFRDQNAFNGTIKDEGGQEPIDCAQPRATPVQILYDFSSALRYTKLREHFIQIYDATGEPIAPEHLTGDKLDAFIDAMQRAFLARSQRDGRFQ